MYLRIHSTVTAVLCILLWKTAFASEEKELNVTIVVDYDPPSTFHRTSENDFRAGSAVTLTCLVNGVNQLGLLYEWSSTCTGNCFAKWQTTGSISTHYLRSHDSGVHTCVVYDGVGCSGNASITMNVVGAGIYVSSGHKVLPNNSIIMTGAGDRIGELRCLSGSQSPDVGRLISPENEDITTSTTDPFLVTRGRVHNSGMLHVRSHSPLPSGDQGVYTCRIPDEDGNTLDVNVGLYLNSEAAPPSILSLESDPNQRTLKCKTTGSPPTSISWTLNGKTLSLDDTTKYESSQLLQDRVMSTYANMLTILNSVEEAIGEYTCSVGNILGNDSTSTSIHALEISGHENPIIVGLEGIITCSTHLNVSKMEWFLVGVDDPVEKTENNQTLVLSLNPNTAGLDGTMFTCKVTTVGGGVYSQTITVAVKELDHKVTIEGEANPVLAGGNYTFMCTVVTDIAPTVKWMGPDGTPVRNNDDDIIVSDMVNEGNLTTVTLTFSSLHSSHGGRYSCNSVVDHPPSTKQAARDIIVKIPPPSLRIIRTPSDNQVFTTTQLTLTCFITVSPAVDTGVGVKATWRGPSGAIADDNRITVNSVSGTQSQFQSSVRFTSLQSSDSGTYNCSFVLSPSISTAYVVKSDLASSTTNVNAALKVTIQISYTPPDQYPDYEPPNYRAASAVTLRCVVEGATGSVSYRWSSTCSSCFASSSSSSSISESFLRSRDQGTHTCTVTDSIGNRGSDSTMMNIVGAGIYVSYSPGHGGQQNAQPKNTYIRIDEYRSSYTRAELYCCSNSTSGYIGSFTVPRGSVYTNDVYNLDIDQLSSSSSYRGCIYFEVQYSSWSHFTLSSSYRGVYTCNIQDANGQTQYVNFGLYDDSFRSAPSLSGLYHTSSQDSSLTLSCRTTTAPPTSITWYKDGTEIDIDWNTTRIRQEVTNRRSSYYDSKLLIDNEPDNVIGQYSCRVGNNYGTRSSGTLTLRGIQISSSSHYVVGSGATLGCTSDLDARSVQWYRANVLVTTSSGRSSTLTQNVVSTDDNDVEYKCRATSPYGVQERSVTLSVQVPDEWATVEITNSTNHNAVDESNYTLTCTVTAIQGMNISPTITWFYPNGSVVQSGGNITVGSPLTEGTVTTSTLSFTPVLSEHGGVYTCRTDIHIPWMSTQPQSHNTSVDMVVTSQAWFQLRISPVQYCTEWEVSKATDLEQWIKKDIEEAVRQRCKCDFFSSAIYSGEFGCRTSKTSVLYRAIINGTSDLHTAGELINFIEDWRTNEGTLLYNMFRLDLTKKADCPLLIGSFNDAECGYTVLAETAITSKPQDQAER